MKSASRLTAMHVHIIGGVVLLVVFLILFFGMIRPKNQQIEEAKAAAATAESAGGTKQAVSKAQNDLKSSKQDTVRITSDWNVYAAKYMPNYNWDPDPLKAYFQKSGKQVLALNDVPTAEGTWVTKWYDAQRGQGITRGEGVEFPVPPLASDPNGVAALTSITFPDKSPWKVTVICKSFDEAMAHLRRFNGMEKHGMPVINDVSISGQSPELEVSYSLALYVIPWQAPPAADARIGSGGATGGGGGGMGGMGGGMGPGGMGGKGGMVGPMTGGGGGVGANAKGGK